MAGDHSRPGDPDGDATSSLDDALLDQRVDGLVERGLSRYAEGDLDGAISEWEHALALEPECVRAREYVDYLRQHYDLLRERFEAAASAGAGAADVPFGLEDARDADDDDAYDLVEVDYGDTADAEPVADAPATPDSPSRGGGLDEGWDLASSDGLPAPPAPPQELELDDALGADLEAVTAGLSSLSGDGALDLDDLPRPERRPGVRGQFDYGDLDDEKTQEKTQRKLGFVRPRPEDEEEADDDEITVPGGGSSGPRGFDDGIELSSDALDALSSGARLPREDTASPEETTAERPGVPGGISIADVADDALTVERGGGGAGWTGPSAIDPSASIDLDEPLFDEETRERPATPGGGPNGEPTGESKRAPTHDSGLNSVIIDDSLAEPGAEVAPGEPGPDEDTRSDDTIDLEEQTREHHSPGTSAEIEFAREADTRDISVKAVRDELATPTEELSAITEADELDVGAPRNETRAERTRRRITELIDRARAEKERADHAAAVALLVRALDEDPDSAAAQKVIHRHRKLFVDIYEAYLGDTDDVPVLAIPMHELGTQKLDNRAAFLLSRIDGTLSFEEILDIAGMARLEAYRHLCTLLLKGVLEVR